MNDAQFPLAPMSPVILVMTWTIGVVPIGLAVTGFYGVAAFVAAVYALIWLLMRPSRFEVGVDGIHLVFPARESRVPRHTIASVTELSKAEFKARFGTALRIGAGGFLGGFGWLWTSKEGLIDFFISRTDTFVLVERVGGKPLLLTPANPSKFVDAVRGLLPH